MFRFVTGQVLFGEVTRVAPSEPMEGDYGTYQRLIVEVQPVDGSAPRQVWLPLPSGWPIAVDHRTVAHEWLRRASAIPELHAAFDAAGTVQEAFHALVGRFFRFEEQVFETGFGDRRRERTYAVPVKVYPNRKACAEEASSAAPATSPPEKPLPSDPSLILEARKVWDSLAAIQDPSQRESYFRQLMGDKYTPALLEQVRS